MTTKKNILKAIRQNCIDCSAGSYKEVEECDMMNCPLFPYRKGNDPNPARRSKNRACGGMKNATEKEIKEEQEGSKEED